MTQSKKRGHVQKKQKKSQASLPRFLKSKWLKAALTHPSYRYENGENHLENFDRLEFLGDAILNLTICRRIYERFPEADEGLLSRLRSILVSKKILLRIAKQIKLHQRILLGKGLKAQNQSYKSKIYTDCFEALIAALYFDQGINRAEGFILKHFEDYLDIKKLFRLDPNPKSTLQELAQKHWQKLPIYTNEPCENGFASKVWLHRGLEANAKARTRKEAEEKSARILIKKIRQAIIKASKKARRKPKQKNKKSKT